MLLRRTEKARLELSAGVRTLGLRERTLLRLATGHKSLLDYRSMFDGQGEQIVLTLVQQGFLEPLRGVPPQVAAAQSAGRHRADVPAALAASSLELPVAPAAPASDSFEGKRSLATTRMFLFDICERMFARRDPVLAEKLRETLRGAKDRESMLAAAREMIAEIERAAGHERADSISERIAMLLPSETTI